MVFDDGGKGQEVKNVGQILPDVCVSIFAEAFIVETINLSDLPGFMISAQNREAVLVPDFEANKQSNSLNRIVSSIDIVTHEKVICVWGLSTDLKEFHKVMELSVNVSAHSDWARYRLYVRLAL